MNAINNPHARIIARLTKVFILVALMGFAAHLSGCNTTEGVGKDIEAVGDKIEDTASDAKN